MDLEKWYSNQKESMRDISKKDINVVGEKPKQYITDTYSE